MAAVVHGVASRQPVGRSLHGRMGQLRVHAENRAVRGAQAMSDPREKITEAIKAARAGFAGLVDSGQPYESLEILARCAEALLKEHAADENSACCVVSSH